MMEGAMIQTIAERIEALENVTKTNRWSKGDHDRLYVEVKSQNRFGNDSKIYIDLNAGEVVSDLRKGQSGAKSYGWAVEVDAAVREIVEVAKTEAAEKVETEEKTIEAAQADAATDVSHDLNTIEGIENEIKRVRDLLEEKRGEMARMSPKKMMGIEGEILDRQIVAIEDDLYRLFDLFDQMVVA